MYGILENNPLYTRIAQARMWFNIPCMGLSDSLKFRLVMAYLSESIVARL